VQCPNGSLASSRKSRPLGRRTSFVLKRIAERFQNDFRVRTKVLKVRRLFSAFTLPYDYWIVYGIPIRFELLRTYGPSDDRDESLLYVRGGNSINRTNCCRWAVGELNVRRKIFCTYYCAVRVTLDVYRKANGPKQ